MTIPEIERAGIRIAATAIYQPGSAVPSSAIDTRVGLTRGTCEKRLGISQRYFSNGETTSVMAVKASQDALATAGWSAEDLDLIVSASAVMEQWIPTQAVLVQQQLGLEKQGTPVLDVNATCLSFLAAFDTVSYAVASGRYRRVLIVSADVPSKALDWNDLDVCGNFGDGAAAVLIEYAPQSASGIMAAQFQTHSDGARLCEIKTGGTLVGLNDMEKARAGALFRMEGPASYRLAAQHFPKFLQGLLKSAGLSISDVSVVVPHQASASALHHLRRLAHVPKQKLIDIFANHGNQVAASLPTALDHAIRSGRVQRGDVILLVGTAAGITLGGMLLRY